MGEDRILYHYCSVDTLLSILQNNSLRLSDVEKSNDYAERKWMTNIIKQEFIKIVNQKGLAELNKKVVFGFSNLIENFEVYSKIYASCFSVEGDLLSQWRAYASDGYGVSIGFSSDILEMVNNHLYGIQLKPIIYSTKKQKEYGKLQAKKILDLLLKGDFLYHAMSEVFENDLASICCYKNPAFSEEKEWRLCIALSPACRIDTKANYDPFIMSEIKLYSNQKEIVTYLDLDFSKVKNKIITEIILGPKCKISINDLKQNLFVLGYETSGINITKSSATYI